ncbi:MAG: exosortase/archaeosortase family protein [Desulfobacterales bacterium]|nr:exosortase/archaeosortase family protein [Desulfobacterales bacterium]
MNSKTATDYKQYLFVGLVCISFLALYHHVIYKMVIDWTIDDNYSHGFLIPVISGYLIWQDRKRLAEIPISPANSGLIFLILSLLFFVATYLGAELFTMRLSMLFVIWSAIIFLAGWSLAKAVFFPIGYLLFMIPLPAIIWNKVAFPLKLFATKMAVSVIQAVNIPVYAEGNIIHLANTTLEVVDACSGLRSLTSLLALSAAFALISEHSRLKKIVLFLSAIPIAILVNIIRLSCTAVLARYYGAQVAEGFLHEMSGIVIFFLALILTYLVHLLLQKAGRATA